MPDILDIFGEGGGGGGGGVEGVKTVDAWARQIEIERHPLLPPGWYPNRADLKTESDILRDKTRSTHLYV